MTALTTATCFGVVFVLSLVLHFLLFFYATKSIFKNLNSNTNFALSFLLYFDAAKRMFKPFKKDSIQERQFPTIVESFFGNMFWVAVGGICSGICLVGFVVSLCFHFFG